MRRIQTEYIMDNPHRTQTSRNEEERRNSRTENVPRPSGLSGEEPTYAEKVAPGASATPIGSKPVFIRHRDIPNADNNMPKGEEIYVSLSKLMDVKLIVGVQKVRGLWRIYIDSKEARVALISEGMMLRGVKTNVYDKNPYINENEDFTRLTIKDIPLSVNDELIVSELEGWKCKVRGKVIRQRLRVNGQLTSCLNGDRAVYIDPPRQSLPRHVSVASFKARIFHDGQVIEASVATCSRCLATGHHASTCVKPFVCNRCRQPGHRAFQCTDRACEDVTQHQRDATPNDSTAPKKARAKNAVITDSEVSAGVNTRSSTKERSTRAKRDVSSKRQQSMKEVWSQSDKAKDTCSDVESNSDHEESEVPSEQWSDSTEDTGKTSCKNGNGNKRERKSKKRRRKGSNKK